MDKFIYRNISSRKFCDEVSKIMEDVYVRNMVYTIERSRNENVVIMSEIQVKELFKEVCNLQYKYKLMMADKEIDKGEVVNFKG